MEEYDLKLDVPARAYINAQLLLLLEKGGTLFEAKKELFSKESYVEVELNSYDYQINDHSLAISLLYCIIVVPREILDLPENHMIFKYFDEKQVTNFFTINEPKQINSKLLIERLRNSVAHALFSITNVTGIGLYKFWNDQKPFNATINHDELLKFLSIIGQRLTNAVLEGKTKLMLSDK